VSEWLTAQGKADVEAQSRIRTSLSRAMGRANLAPAAGDDSLQRGQQHQ
jgi:hypothetical protein